MILQQSLLVLLLLVGQHVEVLANSANLDSSQSPAAIKLPSATDEIQLPALTTAEQELFDLIKGGNYAAARKTAQSQLQQATAEHDRRELLSLLAYIDLQLDKANDALRELQSLPEGGGAKGLDSIRQHIITLKRIGDTYLRLDKKSKAISTYKLALSLSDQLNAGDPVLIDLLNPLVGCLLQDKEYVAAQPYAEQLVSICQTRAASGELYDVASLFYAYVQLLQIYRVTNLELHANLIAKAMPLLDQLLLLRAKYEGHTPEAEAAAFERLQNAMLHAYVAMNKPDKLSDYLWLASQFRMRSLPLIDWQPPDKNPKAVIVCVHAFGLENRAFTPFGREMSARHFAVYAMDVRGFGAWQSEFGSETVSFDRALSDIRAVIQITKIRHPGLPVFLLGESMGGAMVLRAASEFGSEMAGVISSVPSAERYGGRRMAAQVAFRLFRSPKRRFDVVTQIAEQATSQERLRELWKKDPKARSELSPVELIKFDRFMKVTKARCSLIRETPVMVVQGLADRLVKPQGTYEMFDNVNSPKKAMIIIGNAEHLIFETTNQPEVLLEGLSVWLGKMQASEKLVR